jgi:hypothetical protein
MESQTSFRTRVSELLRRLIHFSFGRKAGAVLMYKSGDKTGVRTHSGHTGFFERREKIQQEDWDALAFPMIPTSYPSQASSEPP